MDTGWIILGSMFVVEKSSTNGVALVFKKSVVKAAKINC